MRFYSKTDMCLSATGSAIADGLQDGEDILHSGGVLVSLASGMDAPGWSKEV